MPGAERVGFIVTTVARVGGALLGGFLATALGLGDPIDEFFDLSTWVAAVVGALIILFVWNAIRERTDRVGTSASGAGDVRGPGLLEPDFVRAASTASASSKRQTRAVVVAAAGELDAFAAPDLEGAFDRARRARPAGRRPRRASRSWTRPRSALIVRDGARGSRPGGAVHVVLPRGRGATDLRDHDARPRAAGGTVARRGRRPDLRLRTSSARSPARYFVMWTTVPRPSAPSRTSSSSTIARMMASPSAVHRQRLRRRLRLEELLEHGARCRCPGPRRSCPERSWPNDERDLRPRRRRPRRRAVRRCRTLRSPRA